MSNHSHFHHYETAHLIVEAIYSVSTPFQFGLLRPEKQPRNRGRVITFMLLQSGSGLIEIVVCIFIASILLLGVDALQLQALREVSAAYHFFVAAEQLKNAHEQALVWGEDDLDFMMTEWNDKNFKLLPQGRGVIHGEALVISWGEYKGNSCDYNVLNTSGCLRLKITGR